MARALDAVIGLEALIARSARNLEQALRTGVLPMNIDVTLWNAQAMPFELVERKGLGHPDTICDALVEQLSSNLSRYYVDKFGAVLHHNVDKALLCGGAARVTFGGGEVTAPIEIHISGRATAEFRGVRIPVEELAVEGSRQWLRQHLSHLDVERHVRLISHVRPTSQDLTALFYRAQAQHGRLANDTSFGVGFAPLSATERVVLNVERALNDPKTRRAHPYIGEDIKVMGCRRQQHLELTVACALVAQHVADLEDYRDKKRRIGELALAAARGCATLPVSATVNAADDEAAAQVYLTVTGLSAEAGDDGQVGRGNRVNGLITPHRPMSLEAAAGKNPVTHVGKLYNVMAGRIAHAVTREVPDLTAAQCYLLSRIGSPIVQPQLFDLRVECGDSELPEARLERIRAVAMQEFAGIEDLWLESIKGTLQLW